MNKLIRCDKLIEKSILKTRIPLRVSFDETKRGSSYNREILLHLNKTLPNFKGKIYPDHSFSVGAVPFRGKAKAEKQYDTEYKNQFYKDEKITERNGKFVLLREGTIKDSYEDSFSFNNTHESSQKIDPIEQSDAGQGLQNKKKYGLRGITSLGKRMTKNGALLLQQKYGRKRLGLITMTCPNYPDEQLRIISQNWAEIVRQFFQQLKRRLNKIGQPDEIICCTEIQPDRYKNRGEIAPHLHFVYVCKNNAYAKKFNILAKAFRRWWEIAIKNVLAKNEQPTPSTVTFGICCDCVPIKHCVAKYMSKYISKGAEMVNNIRDEGREDELPSQWWTASKAMKKMFYDSLIHLSDNDAAFFFYNLDSLIEQGYLLDGKVIEVEINGISKVVGVVGIFSDAFYEQTRDNYKRL